MKIMQCWDDGVVNDIRLCELLRKYGAKATFNINPGKHKKQSRVSGWSYREIYPVFKLRLDEMKDVYASFKIGGHTMTHPRLPEVDADTLKSELVACKAFIADFFGQDVCGFAYPCGDYNQAVKDAVKNAGYLYARTTKKIDGLLDLSDPMELHSHCKFNAPDFWDKYETVRKLDGVFYFWGHSYEMMDDDSLWAEFEEKLAKIKNDSAAEWIDVIDLF